MSSIPPVPNAKLEDSHIWRDWFNLLREGQPATTTTIQTISGQVNNPNSNVLNISGDATGTGSGALTLVLNTVNTTPGTYNGITVNEKGLVTNIDSTSTTTGSIGNPGIDGEDGEDSFPIPGSSIASNLVTVSTTIAPDTSYVAVNYLNISAELTINGNLAIL
jgi:hypothetical protein